MQSVGLVNDHARFCFRYKELTQTRFVAQTDGIAVNFLS